MEWIIVLFTIVGGLAAIWFLWDKIKAWWTPIPMPPSVEPGERLVDFNYPRDSELQQRLETEGYRIRWCRRENLTRLVNLEGWEYVLEDRPDSPPVRLTTGDMVLMKKKG